MNPRKTDLHRWRETFAEKLRGWGIEAEATRQASRGESRNFEPLWRVKARHDGRLNVNHADTKTGPQAQNSRAEAMVSWAHILKALAASEVAEDRLLAKQLSAFVRNVPFVQERLRHQRPEIRSGIETPQRQAFLEMQPGRSDAEPSR